MIAFGLVQLAAAMLAAPAAATPVQPVDAACAQRQQQRQFDDNGFCDRARIVAPRRWRDGKTIVYQNRRMRLVATAKRGKLISLTPVNLTSRPVKSRVREASRAERRPCIWCEDTSQPLGCCREVPCEWLRFLKWISSF